MHGEELLWLYRQTQERWALRPMGGDKEIQPDQASGESGLEKKDNTVFCHRREIEL